MAKNTIKQPPTAVTNDIIRNKRDFDHFLHGFIEVMKSYPCDWEDMSLLEFFENLAISSAQMRQFVRQARDTSNHKEPSWELFAELLLAATVEKKDLSETPQPQLKLV